MYSIMFIVFFFFNDTASSEIYTLSLHDALPICPLLEDKLCLIFKLAPSVCRMTFPILASLLVRLNKIGERFSRNAETDLVCRLLLEKKKQRRIPACAGNATGWRSSE